MKKIIQLFILALVVNTSYAQVIYEQNFNDGTIGDMTMIDRDGNTPNANVGLLTEAWNILNGTDGTPAALSTSWFTPAGTADDWLITPQMNISDAKTALNWQARTYDAMFPDGYEVRVSTTDNNPDSFTEVLFSTSAEQASENLASRSASLADFVGKDVYIAFINNSTDAYILELDNIVVKILQARDVAIKSFNTKRFHLTGATVPVSITLENNGAETLTSIDFVWSNETDTYTDNLTGLSVPTGGTLELVHTQQYNLASVGAFPTNVSLSNPNGDIDLNDVDNVMVGKLGTVATNPNRKVVVEEGTGTWCGWCPRGAVGLETMAEKYPESFIGIAVHNADPMTIAEYDGPLGISGFPGSKVNRGDESVNPSATVLDGAVLAGREEVTPATASVTALGDKENRTVTISASANFATPLFSDDFRFAAVIIENGVTGTADGYDQVNYYAGGGNGPMGGYENLPDPVPAADMVYDHVARAILGGFDGQEGSIPADVNSGDTPSYEFTYDVPQNMNMDELHVAVLLIDNATGEIYNGDEAAVKFPVSTTEIVDESISKIYPNPASDVAFIDINLVESADVTLQVVDMMGKTISNQNLGKLSGTNKMTYDVSNLNTGMYMFRVTAGELVSTKRISVAK